MESQLKKTFQHMPDFNGIVARPALRLYRNKICKTTTVVPECKEWKKNYIHTKMF